LKRLPYLLLLVLLVPASALADEVYLVSAGTLSGRIVEQTEATVTVDVGGGVISVPTSRVERIVKGRTPLDDYDQLTTQIGPQDVDGWRNLGRWASQQGLSKQASQAYEKVLALAPDDAKAREALGFVWLGGRWLTEEESYPARGYVKYDGEWMTPAEAELAQQQDAAANAAEEARRAAEEQEHQAAVAAMEAEDQARWAAEEARKEEEELLEAQSEGRVDQPVYWGSWGYGVTYWPATPGTGQDLVNRPVNRPAHRPVNPGRVPR
jgi:hypothetical protein